MVRMVPAREFTAARALLVTHSRPLRSQLGNTAPAYLGRLQTAERDQASRSIGQLMHRGPPRPRPSSLPRIVITAIPFSRR